LILLVLIGIVFINRKYIQPVLGSGPQNIVLSLSFVGCIILGYYVLNHLPQGMKSAEELGLKPTKYATIYTLENSKTGESQKVSSEAYVSENWWQKEDWKILKDQSETVVLEEGYEPPVHDFIIDLGGAEITDQVLGQERIFLLEIPFLGLTASLPSVIEEKAKAWNTRFSFASVDETTLKTIVRANPGIVLLENGVVIKKWHYHLINAAEKYLAT
ncbi:unnamed protein product, partial [Pylaiella littoralis]